MNNVIQNASPAPRTDGTRAKRPYITPKVFVHGTVAELTLAAKTAGIPDTDSAGSHVQGLL